MSLSLWKSHIFGCLSHQKVMCDGAMWLLCTTDHFLSPTSHLRWYIWMCLKIQKWNWFYLQTMWSIPDPRCPRYGWQYVAAQTPSKRSNIMSLCLQIICIYVYIYIYICKPCLSDKKILSSPKHHFMCSTVSRQHSDKQASLQGRILSLAYVVEKWRV